MFDRRPYESPDSYYVRKCEEEYGKNWYDEHNRKDPRDYTSREMDKKKFAERAAIYFRRCGGVLMYFENIEAGSLFAIRLKTDFNTIVVFQIDSNEPIEYKNILKHVDKNLKVDYEKIKKRN